ncbi:hypothetical protein [Ramlibacter humi]|uniref:DUF5666 domain-containing protein n=1 Tax=Ramlibacter humi TaxID=2530451 RepID=A0A4Z0BFU7_9BURK|nr:hypothetical protein [Ramlibacter humi]TFY98215.1 hypothetical protein EZ216_16585 [Ramlibacter humi]
MALAFPRRRLLAAALVLAVSLPAFAQNAPLRLRGTIESVDANRLVLRDRSGEQVDLALPANLVVTEVVPAKLSDIQPGSFVGAGAMPQPDGTQKAIAVLVFPETMRGTGEGHRPFDFLPQSTMTNATVAGIASAADGSRLKVAYPGGEQTIVVPPEAVIFSVKPGSRDLLVPGTRVSLTAQQVDGKPTATRISAGRNGFAPPY